MRTVQIFGGAPADEPIPEQGSADKWGLNNLWMLHHCRKRYTGWTEWVDCHHHDHIKGRKQCSWSWLTQQTKPVVMWAAHPDIPASKAYELSEVFAAFNTKVFSSSFDWMMARAIYQRFERIDLYGWRMKHVAYEHQVVSGQFWIQQAKDRGIVVVNHSPSSMFDSKTRYPAPVLGPGQKMYGLETTDRALLYRPGKRP